jgi:hypothetical protein
VVLHNVCPVDVFSESDENTRGALVCAFGQHDIVSFAEYNTITSISHDFRKLLRSAGLPRPQRLWSKLWLVHSPGLFQLGPLRFLLGRDPRSISFGRFQNIEPLRFGDGSSRGRLQPL